MATKKTAAPKTSSSSESNTPATRSSTKGTKPTSYQPTAKAMDEVKKRKG